MSKHRISEDILKKYFKLTESAIQQAKLTPNITKKELLLAKQFKDMAKRYLNDARYFAKAKEYVTAFAAVNYAHAWLDACAIAGWIDVKGKSNLFMTD